MLKMCLVFWKFEPQYAYKRYAYKKKHVCLLYRRSAIQYMMKVIDLDWCISGSPVSLLRHQYLCLTTVC